MATTQNLTIRIGADASGAISVLGSTTTAVNNLGRASTTAATGVSNLNAATHTTSAGIVLTGDAARETVASLSRLSNQTNLVSTSMHSMTAAMGTSAQSSARWVQELNNSTRAAQQAANANEQLHRSNTAVSGSMNSLKSVVGMIGLGALARDILKVNIEFESLRMRLIAVTGSAELGRIAFQNILQVAKETPQSVQEIAKAYTMLKNFGIEPTMKVMQDLTNMTSKLGGSSDTLSGITLALGQAFGKGKLQAQDTNQMIERGVPVYKLLGEVTGKTSAEIVKMMEAGELTRPIIEKLIAAMGSSAVGASATMMDSLGGKINVLGDAWHNFEDALMGDKSEGIIKTIVSGWTEILEGFSAKMNSNISQKIVELKENIKAHDEQPWLAKQISYSMGYNRADKLQEIEDLKAMQIKGFIETRETEKTLNQDKKTQELANNAGIAKDADAFMKKQMGLIKENQQAYFDAAQEKYNISAKALKSLAALESGFNNQVNAGDRTKAQGVFQFFPAAAKDMGTTIDAILKDESLAVEKGAGYFAKMLDASNGHFIEAVARFHDGSGAIDAIIKKRGAFDLNLVSKEGQLEVERFEAGLKVLGVTVSDLEKPYQQAAQATKHLATEHEKAAKKIADEYNRLVETFNGKDPFKDYAKSMAELNSVQKDLSPETFLLNQQKIAAEFEKNTVDLKAYNDELARHKKYLDNVGDYNSTIDELTRNKQRGAISKGEYGLGVAQANAGLMNQVTDKQIAPKNVGEVIDATNANESEKALAKLNEQATKTIDSFNQLGDSGKMAFDGILGGISAVASAATNFGEVMTKLNDSHTDYAKNYQAFIEDSKNSEADKASAKLAYEKENAAYQSKSFQAEISGARQIAGATAKLFGEKSAARKAFHAIEMGMSVIEMAMAAKKMIVDVAAGAANMFSQGGFAGFAGVAAMAAVMAGLGLAMSGGSGKAVMPEYTKTTGTVLGDKEAQSHSVENVSKTLEEIHAREYPALKNIADSMGNFVDAIDKLLVNVVRTGGIKLGTVDGTPRLSGAAETMKIVAFAIGAIINPIGALATFVASKIPIIGDLINGISNFVFGGLFGKVTKSVVGGGIKINDQSINDVWADGSIDGNTSTIVETKKKSWFSTTRKISEMLTALDDSVKSGLTTVITSMAASVASFWGYLGLDMQKGLESIGSFRFSAFIKTFGMKDTEVSDALKNWTSMTFDNLVEHVLGGFTKQFQRMGETLAETMGRLVSDANTVKESLRNAGMATNLTGENLVIFSQQMIDATGGLKNFVAGMDTLINKFVSKDTKAKISAESVTAVTGKAENIATASQYGVDLTAFSDFADSLKNGKSLTAAQIDEMGNKLLASVNVATDKFADVSSATNQYQTVGFTKAYDQAFNHESTSPSKDYDKFNSVLAIANNPQYALTASTTTEEAKIFSDSLQGKNGWDVRGDKNFLYNHSSVATKKMLDANSAAKEEGENWLKENGYSLDKDALDAAKNTAAKNLKPFQDLIDDLTGIYNSTATLKDRLTEENKANSAIQESILKQLTTPVETLDRARKIVLDGLDDTKAITGADETVIKAFNEWLAKTGQSLDMNAYNLQRFNNSLEDTEKSLAKLSEAGKYLTDFSKSISDWVKNIKATKIGTPTTQFKAAQDNFDAQISKIKDAITGEDKRAAMAGITGYADAYLEAIKSYYGSGVEAQGHITTLMSKMDGIDTSVTIQDLQLGKLDEIKNGILALPVGISKENEAAYAKLLTDMQTAGANYKADPSMANSLTYDSYAKIILSINEASKAGVDGKFIDQLISGVSGASGLQATVDLMIKSGVTQEEINSLLNNFNATALNIKSFGLTFTGEDLQKKVNEAVTTFGGLTSSISLTLNSNAFDANEKDGIIGKLNTGFASYSTTVSATLKVTDLSEAEKSAAITSLTSTFSGINAGIKTVLVNDSATPLSKPDLQAALDGLFTISGALTTTVQAALIDSTLVGKTREDFIADTTTFLDQKTLGLVSIISGDSTQLGLDIGVANAMPLSEKISTFIAKSAVFNSRFYKSNGLTFDDKIATFDANVTSFTTNVDLATGSATAFNTPFTSLVDKNGTKFDANTNPLITAFKAANDSTASFAGSMERLNTAIAANAIANATQTAITPPPKLPVPPVVTPPTEKKQTFYEKFSPKLVAGKDADILYMKRDVVSGISAADKIRLDTLFGATTRFVAYEKSTGTLAASDSTGHAIGKHINDLPMFAKGGIANQPSIFGEAGAEAAVPLPDGRTIPVTLNRPASNDSNTDNTETIAELKKQNQLLEENNRQLQALIKTMQAGIQQSANDSEEQTRELKTIARRVMS